MPQGWLGAGVAVDLSNGSIRKETFETELLETYLGGRGMGVKMAWDSIPPETDPLSEQNSLIITTGTLTGTLCPGANRTIVTTRSPQNNLLTYGSLGGFFGPELKFAGYDSLVVTGCSTDPVYIWINDGKVQLRDARHLWGKDTFETQARIRDDLQCADTQIMCIGPAGEKRGICASIEHATGASVSRNGVAAVLGHKNLKAIAVRGTGDISVARPDEFGQLCDELVMNSSQLKAWHDDYSHNHIANLARFFFAGNPRAEFMSSELGDLCAGFLDGYRTKRPGCFNCQASCRSTVRLPGGALAHGKCGAYHKVWVSFKMNNFVDCWLVYEAIERFGLDLHSFAALAKFAIGLYQKGIITLADTGGLHLEFGSRDVALKLVEKVARREDIGDVLAKGIHEAGRQIGNGAEDLVDHIKKMELGEGVSHRLPYFSYATAVSDRGDLTRAISYVPHHLFRKSDEFKAEYVRSRFWGYPEEWKYLAKFTADQIWRDPSRISRFLSWDRDEINLTDSAGLCTFWTCRRPFSPIKARHTARLISYATGLDIDLTEALKISARSGAIFRAYNTILGVRRKDDYPPARIFREPDGRLPPMDIDLFERVLGAYYDARGWTPEGVPTGDTLRDLGLAFVANELDKRGVYNEGECICRLK